MSADASAMLSRIAESVRPTLATRLVGLDVAIHGGVEVTGISTSMVDRMMTRLTGAVLALAAAGETIKIDLAQSPGGQAVLSVDRPAALIGLADVVLRDPAYDPETPYPDAPLLGLGFTLRLVESLARDAGGRFAITANAFVLTLPGARAQADLPAGTPTG